ncbi:hypothetical protein FIBSPDRAFT_1052145 [Athelia psychrophila]|uniref:Uncharacterized protein n=1 Tax=Athelia psychrophila TaxID=1759441 RepID=A0A165XTM6_9AGAM|nr:hypothetical protein FIBSPDRAFT_1052145 [Fibularhizoctonia sp. CBS 109695]
MFMRQWKMLPPSTADLAEAFVEHEDVHDEPAPSAAEAEAPHDTAVDTDTPITIAFASHEVADEWWRAMSTHPEMSTWIKRASPQLYLWTGVNQAGTLSYGSHNHAVSQISDKMVSLWQFNGNGTYGSWYGPLGIIPVQDTPDLASGNSFFIRSKVEPHEYWYCPTTEANHWVSTAHEKRTQFIVSLADKQMSQGTIMIGTDDVFICLAVAPNLLLDCTVGGIRLAEKGAGKSVKLSDVRTKYINGESSEWGKITLSSLVVAAGGGKYGNWELV